METKELLRKVKALELKTRGFTKQVFSGEYHSAFKGKGMTFSEVKSYSFGDDVRNIDWKVTARFDEPYVKVFEEERELTVMLLLDLSGSTDFGSAVKSKKELLLELAATVAFSAIRNNDKVGAIFITDTVEKFIPAKKGRKHVLLLLRELIEFEPTSSKTNIQEGIKFFRNIQKKRCIAFMISDFFDDNDYWDALGIINKKHDFIALQLHDPMEQQLLDLGIVEMKDAESNSTKWINTSVANQFYKQQYENWENELHSGFKRRGIEFIKIATNEMYFQKLIHLFKKRK